MKEKIKNLFIFLKSAWTISTRGKIGIAMMFAACRELAVLQKNLNQIQHHIYLLQRPNPDSDYIQELGLKTLNLGNPEFKELKY